MNHLMWIIRMVVAASCVGCLYAADCKCGADAKKEDAKAAKGIQCPVDVKSGCKGSYCHGKDKPEETVEYEGRKVYFCCSNCAERFQKDPKPYLDLVKAQWKLLDEAKKQ